MPSNLFSPEELEGQRLASILTAKLKELADERFDEAIKNLALQNSNDQIQSLCEAIENAILTLKSDPSSAIASAADLEMSITSAKEITESTNNAIKELVEVAKAPREVVYDAFGRVIEIKRKI